MTMHEANPGEDLEDAQNYSRFSSLSLLISSCSSRSYEPLLQLCVSDVSRGVICMSLHGVCAAKDRGLDEVAALGPDYAGPWTESGILMREPSYGASCRLRIYRNIYIYIYIYATPPPQRPTLFRPFLQKQNNEGPKVA